MQLSETSPYIGRFAPSPTGPLHFGSLVTAVASYLQARSKKGRWLLRIEDIDPPRQQKHAAELIVRTMENYGFEWYGSVIYQSKNYKSHKDALNILIERSMAYPCICTRKDMANSKVGPLGAIYSGSCRNQRNASNNAYRILTNNKEVEFYDQIHGRYSQKLECESGDFIVLRRDGLIAYNLAVIVDDEIQGISEVVRGYDLLSSTPRQVWLQKLLNYNTPRYSHIPIITYKNGSKLSKLNGSTAISEIHITETIYSALKHLNQNPPKELASAPLLDVWSWAIKNWKIEKLIGKKAVILASQ
ncbi:MAG: tRNA glutamyl-Q(34) synthetase GluQRS [Gammaproteobacteria bacterium]|nr:tRNA glutamyl-Q(34) synthetase GluQRS [Gammaproteobacteria bacterium]